MARCCSCESSTNEPNTFAGVQDASSKEAIGRGRAECGLAIASSVDVLPSVARLRS